jgi:hypothetical protein
MFREAPTTGYEFVVRYGPPLPNPGELQEFFERWLNKGTRSVRVHTEIRDRKKRIAHHHQERRSPAREIAQAGKQIARQSSERQGSKFGKRTTKGKLHGEQYRKTLIERNGLCPVCKEHPISAGTSPVADSAKVRGTCIWCEKARRKLAAKGQKRGGKR